MKERKFFAVLVVMLSSVTSLREVKLHMAVPDYAARAILDALPKSDPLKCFRLAQECRGVLLRA